MAYTSAIFFLDYVNGSDTVRTALSGVVFSNPSADIVLGTKVGHGLVTGSVITVSGCTQAYANTAWKVTRVNDDTFTLDTASWASFNGADVTGDAVPFGGQSWADAWKTITSGATAARIAPGDIVKIAKSPAPVILSGATGHATWTNLSKTVTLADAQTATIELCEANWTAVNATSANALAVATDAKEGSYCVKMIEDASPVNDEVQAYYDIYTHDTTVHNLSGYQKISFWIKNEVAIVANQLEINLCSNADGTGDVDTFAIPAIPSTGRWVPLTIARTGGGNLGNAIKSINISNGSNTTEYTASKYVYIDCFIACTTAGLNLQSLISKNTAEQGGTEGWYGIQSIVGVTVLLDGGTNCKANAGRGYYTSGTSPETVDSYIRETTKTDMASSTTVQTIQDSGSFGSDIQFLGGYDITDATGATCDGETFFDGLNGVGYGISMSSKNYLTIDKINVCRYDRGLSTNGLNINNITTLSNANNNGYGVFISCPNSVIGTIGNANNNETAGVYCTAAITSIASINANNNDGYGIYISGAFDSYIALGKANNNYSTGYYFNGAVDVLISSGITASNRQGAININSQCKNFFLNSSFGESPVVYAYFSFTNSSIFVQNEGSGVSHIYTEYGDIVSDSSANRHTASGICWKMSPTNVIRNSLYPLELSIAKVACAANAAVTVKVFAKVTNTTDIFGKLVLKGGQIAGDANCVSGTSDTTANADTNYEELSITFTPTEAGVVEIVFQAYWAANTADESVYVDDLTITQA